MLVALFFVLLDNYTFFKNTLEIYPPQGSNIWFLFSTVVVLFALITFVFTLLSSKWTTKPLLIVALIISSLTNYFMNTYNIVIDDSMIRNTLQTDIHESMDILSLKLLLYLLFLGILPAYFVYRSRVTYGGFKQELLCKIKVLLLSLAVMVAIIFAFSKHYTSFAREHKPLRYSTNPTYWIYSIGNYIHKTINSGAVVVKPLGEDATIPKQEGKPKLVIMVVGEAARADHFSLNGYKRETNPLLKQEKIINFDNVYSCGTATAESVPCMFSVFDRSNYSYRKGISHENLLDVLKHTNTVSVLWRDNNSNSKGVALRVSYEDYKTKQKNTVCTEGECRDEGMLVGLDDYVSKHQKDHILIILHQMGNHGPAYYKRYPKAFEKFTPVCRTNQLEECSKEEITNAYDNAILYTDHFLSKVITFLKSQNQSHQTAMFYMSDHGESLGENGLYLHGLPYFMAPEAQKHIGAIMWFDETIKQEIPYTYLEQISHKKFSQDNLFHTLLGIFGVKTKVYDQKLDLMHTKD